MIGSLTTACCGENRLMLRKLWQAVEEWTKSNYAGRVRVILGAVGAHSTRDIEDWKEVRALPHAKRSLDASSVLGSCKAW